LSKGKGDCPYFVLIAVLACGILAANAFLAGRPVAPPEGGRPASGRLFLADDALISLRYSQRLLEGKGLTWTDGEKVEGYSNLLWTLSCAALGACGLDLILAARLLGFLGMAAAVSAIVFAFRPVRGPPESDRILPAAFGAFALALSTPIAVWTIGGLEQPLLLGLLAWAVVLSYPSLDGERVGARRLLTIGFLLAGVVLTRPEGALLAVLVCLAVAASRGKDGQPVRSLLILAALPAAAYLGQLAFRMAYYGEWLPNTAQVKLGLSRERLREGSVYVARGAAAVWPLLLAAAVALVAAARDRYRRGRTGLLAAIALAWLVYIVLVGGTSSRLGGSSSW